MLAGHEIALGAKSVEIDRDKPTCGSLRTGARRRWGLRGDRLWRRARGIDRESRHGALDQRFAGPSMVEFALAQGAALVD